MSNEKKIMIGSVEHEFLTIEKGEGWTSFFNKIRDECAENHTYSSSEAKKSQNKNLNRYKDVNPYDHSRILLSTGSNDYINANLVILEPARRKYILTQGPLPNTTSHFWLMVWEQKCKGIVMLNRIIEKNMVKCHQYWPTQETLGEEKSFVFDDVHLKVTNLSEEKEPNYTTTTLRLENLATGNQREVLHFHYTTWPDFGVPQSPTAFLRFLDIVRSSGALDYEVGPPVVHCSAGIGRSGTFCLVDSCIVLIRDLEQRSIVVKDILMEMRKYRMGLIQTPGQLRFSYLAIIKGVMADNENGLDEDIEEIKDSESEEEPPPLPPPRNESLTRTEVEEKPVPVSVPSPSPLDDSSSVIFNLVTAATTTTTTTTTTADQAKNLQDDSDISGGKRRKLIRNNKNEALEKKLKEMKKKLQETESWRRWKNTLFHPWTIGCLIAVGGGILVYSALAARG